MIKLIASDMDGTLLNKDGTIHERNISAIKKAIEKGIIFVPATGRANNTIPSQIFEHFPIRYNLSSNFLMKTAVAIPLKKSKKRKSMFS